MSEEAAKPPALEWTGERYVPELAGEIRLEHVHRYLIARELARDRRVLDIACGEGYGAAMLATVASHVFGVDNAAAAVAHASSRYQRSNLQFRKGRCDAIPLRAGSVDVVVSFETIEHIDRHEGMMREVRRVLCPDGLLIVSSPDRREYSDALGNRNEFHLRELDRDEFEQLLRSHFRSVAVAGQRVRGGSIVAPLDDSTESRFVTFPSTDPDAQGVPGLHAPVYLLALASDGSLPPLPIGLADGGPLTWSSDLAMYYAQVQGHCAVEIGKRLGEVVQLDPANADALRAEFNRQADRVSEQAAAIAGFRSLEAEIENAREQTVSLGGQLVAANAQVAWANEQAAAAHSQLVAANAQVAWANEQAAAAHSQLGVANAQVAVANEQAAAAHSQLGVANALVAEANEGAVAAHSQLVPVNAQLADALDKLAAANSELVAVRAVAKAHAAASEGIEQKVRRLEAELEGEHHGARESQFARDLARHDAQIVALQGQVDIYERSRSWRFTAPLRDARRALGRASSKLQAFAQGVRRRFGRPLEAAVGGAAGQAAHAVSVTLEVNSNSVSSPILESSEPGHDNPSGPFPSWLYEEPTNDYVSLSRSVPVETRIKLIAFYLPQFHPIPENDAWWGKGFTEWANVARARPQFVGHYQPHLPGELGFYDLRLIEVQRRQIELARLYGLYGFCFHHYWFGGTRLLRRPLEQFLAHPELDFPFCLCWANENWTRKWDGLDNDILIEQHHSPEDDLAFIRDIEPALRDPRYVRVGGRPLLVVYRPALLPDPSATAQRWRVYCREVGLGELFLVSTHAFDRRDPREFGFDAATEFAPNNMAGPANVSDITQINPDFRGRLHDYRELVAINSLRDASPDYRLFRCVTPMWDNEARRPSSGAVFAHSSPGLYREWLESACDWTERHGGIGERIMFVNAWNEWAEGAHLEPDRRYGYAYLHATAEALERFPIRAGRASIVCVSHDAYFHGAQILVLNLARTLATRLNYAVDVILCGPGPLATEFESVARVHDFARPELTWEARLAVVQQLYREGARIAICNTSVVGETVELLKLAGFAVVSLIHELPGLIRSCGLEASINRIAEHADKVVFAANVVRDKFIAATALPSGRSVVQPQGLFAPNEFFGRRESARRELRARLGVGDDAHVILAVGYADHRKGIDLFVEVGIRVAERLENIAFVWVGHQEPSAFDRARARLEHAGLIHRFIFPGLVRNSDLFFAGADVYLMTSREDPFPNVVVQALDAGVPVIGFEEAGGFVELLQQGCGVLVPFGDTGAMAAELLRLLKSPAERAQLASVAHEILAREFSFVNYARTLVELVKPAGPRISVIVPNFNYARYLPARLESIVRQTYPPHEIVFLDDCSTDNSVEIAAEILHASGLSYRIITNDSNQGTYRQWLRGLQEATGDLIWIAEADDDCAPNMLERLVPQFDQPGVVLAYCQSRQIDEEGREIAPDYLAYTADISETKWSEDYVRNGLDEIRDTLVVKNTIPSVSAVVMRKSNLSSIEQRLLGLRNAGDWLTYVHLLTQGDIAFVSEPLNAHRRHSSSVTIGRGGLNLMREILMVQHYALERHGIAVDTERKREASLEATYKYLGLDVEGPESYREHDALKVVEWVTTG